MRDTAIRWSSITVNVDIDSGEIITNTVRDRDYIIIKTTKHVRINELKTAGQIEYTKQCRRKPQLELF